MVLENYLVKQAVRPKILSANVPSSLALIVVIPAYDEDSVLKPLQSLQEAKIAGDKVEVILVFNASEKSRVEVIEKNQKAAAEAKKWFDSLLTPNFQLHIIEENQLAAKHAGVGLARKIGMDEAIRRFKQIAKPDGIIVCFDADSQCQENYLEAIESHFKANPQTSACSLHFEHLLAGNEFTQEVYRGIAFYELHLRYYKNALGYAGLPYAFHTIGSSMAVKAVDYCKQGGMNKRKAGEDFYFLQKFIKLGNFTELKTTKVIPSPRQSHRVPFGTGRAIQEMLDQEREIEFSYAWESVIALKESFAKAENWYNNVEEIPFYLKQFVGEDNFIHKIKEIRTQSTSKLLFVKRLFHWFDAFQCLKFMHFLRDEYFPNQLLIDSVPKLLNELNQKVNGIETNSLLEKLREVDRA